MRMLNPSEPVCDSQVSALSSPLDRAETDRHERWVDLLRQQQSQIQPPPVHMRTPGIRTR